MKAETSMKITKQFRNVIGIRYCGAQHLLRFREPSYYNAGQNGWNNDIYVINYDTIIVTGYNNLRGITPDYDVLKALDSEAERIICDNSIPYEEKEEMVDVLLKRLIDVTIS